LAASGGAVAFYYFGSFGHVQTAPPVITGYFPLRTLHSFTQNGVSVEIRLEKDNAGNAVLASTYTPTQAGFHLYSKDLPRQGIAGAGRPTLLELPQAGGLQVLGPLFADQPVVDYPIEGFTEPFPIYPDGPVTLRLPVELQPLDEAEQAQEISVTYMACSSQGRCLPPVIDKRIRIIF
jgi:hypothetical protein